MPARDRVPASLVVGPLGPPGGARASRSRSPQARAVSEASDPPSSDEASACTALSPSGARRSSRPSRWDRGKTPDTPTQTARSFTAVPATVHAAALTPSSPYQPAHFKAQAPGMAQPLASLLKEGSAERVRITKFASSNSVCVPMLRGTHCMTCVLNWQACLSFSLVTPNPVSYKASADLSRKLACSMPTLSPFLVPAMMTLTALNLSPA